MNPVPFIKGAVFAGVMAFGFALGLAWEHRGHTPGAVSWITGQSLRTQRDALQAAISAPGIGWSAKLDQCHANGAALSGSLITARERLDALSSQSAGMVAESAKASRDASRAADRLVGVANEILGRAPASSDLCASAEQLIRDYR